MYNGKIYFTDEDFRKYSKRYTEVFKTTMRLEKHEKEEDNEDNKETADNHCTNKEEPLKQVISNLSIKERNVLKEVVPLLEEDNSEHLTEIMEILIGDKVEVESLDLEELNELLQVNSCS